MGFLAIVGTGTVFYHFVEEWSCVDSLYFTVVMLTTSGFGDFYPTTEFSRIFTILFILIGVSFILGFLNFIMTSDGAATSGREAQVSRINWLPRVHRTLATDGGRGS